MADQAGLGDQAMTMNDRQSMMRDLLSQGYSPAAASSHLTSIGVPPPVTNPAAGIGDDPVDTGMGMGELAFNYGPRSVMEGALSGASGIAEDWFGAEGTSDVLDSLADAVGPSDEQNEQRAIRDEARGFKGDAIDAIAQEMPTLGAQIGIGAGAGAIAGSVVPGLGNVVGGIVGAIAGAGTGMLRMYDQGKDNVVRGKVAAKLGIPEDQLTQEQIDGTDVGPLTEEERMRVTAVGALGLMDAFPGTKILGKIAPGKTKAALAKHLMTKGGLKAGAKAVGKTGLQEGMFEVTQELGTLLLTDTEVHEQVKNLPEGDILELGELIATTHGRDLALSFVAGFGLGAGAHGVVEPVAQAKKKKELATISGVAERQGTTVAELEAAAADPERAQQTADVLMDVTQAQNARDAAARAAEQAPPEARGDANDFLAKQDARLEQAIDRMADLKLAGFKTVGDQRTAKAEAKVEAKKPIMAELEAIDPDEEFSFADDLDPEELGAKVGDYTSARARRLDLEQAVETAPTKKSLDRNTKKLQEAQQAEVDARGELAVLEGKDAETARTAALKKINDTQAARVERTKQDAELAKMAEAEATKQAEIDRVKADEYTDADGAPLEESVQRSLAQDTLDSYKADEKKQNSLVEQIARRKEKLRTAKTVKARNQIKKEIAEREGKLANGEPLSVTAARQTLKALDGDLLAEAPSGEAGTEVETPVSADTATGDEGGAASPEKSPQSASAAKAGTAKPVAKADADLTKKPKPKARLRKPKTADPEVLAGKINDLEVELASVEPGSTKAADIGRKINKLQDQINDPAAKQAAGVSQSTVDAQNRIKRESKAKEITNIQASLERASEGVRPALEAQLATKQAELAAIPEPVVKTAADDVRNEGHRLSNDAVKAGLKPWKSLLSEVTAALGPNPKLVETEQWMREWTADSGIEASAHFRGDELLGIGHNGNDNGVMPPKNGWRDPDVVFTHTHPQESPFSIADVLAMRQSGQPFRAVLPSQTLEMAPTPELASADIDQIRDVMEDELVAGGLPLRLSTLEMAQITQEATLQRLEADSLIDYKSDYVGLTRNYEEMIDGAIRRSTDANRGGRASAAAQTAQAGGDGVRTGQDGTEVTPEAAGPRATQGLNFFRTADEPRPAGVSANPERVADLVNDLIEEVKASDAAKGPRVRRTDLEKAIKSGELTADDLARGIQFASNAITMSETEASTVIMQTALTMYPDVRPTGKDFRKPTAAEKREGKRIEFPADWKTRNNIAFQMLNRIGANAGMGFEKTKLELVNSSNQPYSITFYTMPKAMEDYLEISPPEGSRFTKPMPDPNDTTQLVRTPKTSRMPEAALEEARNSARVMQAQVYNLDHDYIATLQPTDLISDKQLGAQGLTRDDDGNVISSQEGNPELTPAQEKFVATQTFRAGRRLKAFKAMAEMHGDEDIGFLYQIDDKGRIAAAGAFTPQTGDAIKKAFINKEAGSLADMPTVDHAASGWQVTVGLSRDAVAAPNFNMGPGSAMQEGYAKRDLYTSTMDGVAEQVAKDAAAGDPVAALFKEKVLDPGHAFGKAQVKGTIIAVNYGAGATKFRSDFGDVFGRHFKGVPKKQRDEALSYAADLGYGQLEAQAPQAMAFQNWALDAITELVSKVESGRVDEAPKLEFAVGLHGKYAKKRFKEQDVTMAAVDGPDNVKQTVTVPLNELDARATARSIYSQMIQGFDASILHRGIKAYKDNGGGFVATNHDSYTVPEGSAGRVNAAAKDSMMNVLQEAGNVPERMWAEMQEQAAKHGVTLDIGPPPALGSFDLSTLPTTVPTFVENAKDAPPAYTDLQGNVVDGAPTFPAFARGINYDAADVGEVSGVRMDTSLPKMAQLAQDNYYNNGKEWKLDVQARALEAQREAGIDLRELTEENKDRLADFLTEDAKAAYVNNKNAIGWYDRKVSAAKEYVRQIFPEVVPGSEAEFQFTYALAVTSNGIKVVPNFRMAAAAYEGMKDGGFPAGIGTGEAASAINNTLNYYKTFVDKMGGWKNARDFMTERMTVREVNAKMAELDIRNEEGNVLVVSGENADTMVRGAAFLGPKIGNGFFSNLYGHFNELTLDRWAYRSVGRWRGNLMADKPKLVAAKQKSFRTVLGRMSPEEIAAIRKLFGQYTGKTMVKKAWTDKNFNFKKFDGRFGKSAMTNDAINNLAFEIARRSMQPAWRNSINALPHGQTIRKLGNGLAKDLESHNEAPTGGGERAYLREIFQKGLDRLRAEPHFSDLTMADLQALIWYPEKLIYESARKPPGVEKTEYTGDDVPDYEVAARKLVEHRLGRAGPIGGGAGGRTSQRAAGDAGYGVPVGTTNAEQEGEQPRVAQGTNVALGRETYPDSWLSKQGVKEITTEQAEALVNEASRITGVPVGPVMDAQGGWADPAQPGGVSTEPSSFTEVMTEDPVELQKFAAVLGEMAGQHSVMSGNTSSPNPNATLVKITTTEDPQKVFKAVNAVNPDKFGGFTATEDGIMLMVPGDYDADLMDGLLDAIGDMDVDIEQEAFESQFVGADTPDTEDGGQGYTASLRKVGIGSRPAKALLRDGRGAAQKIFSQEGGLNGRQISSPVGGLGGTPQPGGVRETQGGNPAPRDGDGHSANERGRGAVPQGSQPARGPNPVRAGKIGGKIPHIKTDHKNKFNREPSPGYIAAALRHDPLYDYDKIIGKLPRSEAGGPKYLEANHAVTMDVIGDLTLNIKKNPAKAKEYTAIAMEQMKSHRAKVAESLALKKISPENVGADGMFKPSDAPSPAMGLDRFMSRSNVEDGGLGAITPVIRDAARAARADPGKVSASVAGSIADFLEDKISNQFGPVRRLEQSMSGGVLADGMDSAFKSLEVAVNDAGRNEAVMLYGGADLDQNGAFSVKAGTKGIIPILDMVVGDKTGQAKGDAMRDWMHYMIAKRAKDMVARGMKTPLTAAEIADGLTKGTPDGIAAAAEWKKHNDANIDFLVKTGRINAGQAKALKADANYVPLYRDKDNNVDGTDIPELDLAQHMRPKGGGGSVLSGRDPGIKALKGGDKKAIDNLIMNMIKNSQAMTGAGMRNIAANQTFDLMADAGLATTTRAVKKGKSGKMIAREKPTPNSVKMWKNGKEVFVVPDNSPAAASVMTALAGLQPRQRNVIEKMLGNIGAIFRQSITLSPAFMIRNMVRDMVSTGVLTSGSNFGEKMNPLSGLVGAYRQNDATQAFKMATGMGDLNFGNPDTGFGSDDILIDYGLGARGWKAPGYEVRKLVKKMEDFGQATEYANRIAVMENLKAKGVRADEAAYQALATMNYSRKGSNAALQVILPMVPFLNARIQGLARLAEGAVGRKGRAGRMQAMKQIALNGALLGIASTLLNALNMEDEENWEKYKDEPLHRRLNYHIIYVGDKTILIPKAFEIGHIFSNIPELLLSDAKSGSEEFGPGVFKMIKDTLLFNAIPAAALPIIEGQANYSFFKEAAIEGMREGSLKARDRTTGASPIAQFVGRQLGISDATKVSPVMIEHYLQGYGGIAYSMMSAATDIVGADLGIMPHGPEGAFGSTPILSKIGERAVGSMFKDTDQASKQSMTQFYENKEWVTQIYRSAKEAATNGDMAYAEKLMAQAPQTKRAYKLMNKASAKMSKLNGAIRNLRVDRNMSAAEKDQAMAPLVKQRNELSAKVMTLIREMEEKQGTTFKAAS